MFGVSPICPAYGRDYKTAEEAKKDLFAGKDFVCANGQYIGLDELRNLGLKEVKVRFAGKRKAAMLALY